MTATSGKFWRAACGLLFVLFLTACSTSEAMRVEVPRSAISGSSRHAALVIDANSGRTLYDDQATELRHPASLTKMMTLYMLFEAMRSGRVSASSKIPVSQHAASQPPSKLWLKAGDQIDVDTAIRALATKSANDVAAAVGEFLGGGSEERFASMMTARARQLGMRNTTFRNASGLHNPEQVTTARDMAILGITLRRRFPEKFAYFSATSFGFRGQQVRGHNNLLGRVQGVDGIKTGYTRASGFNIVTSVRDGRKSLVVVVMGGRSARARNDEVEMLISRTLGRPATTVYAARPVSEAPAVVAPAAPAAMLSVPAPASELESAVE